MKYFCIIALLIAGSAGLMAQTGAPVATNDPAMPESTVGATNKLTITSDSGGFDFLSNKVVYRGNVSAVDPQFKLTCQWLTAKGEGSEATNIVATTNVVILTHDSKKGSTESRGDQAEYVFQVIDNVTNKTITLTSFPGNPNPVVRFSNGSQSGRVIVFNLLTEEMECYGGGGEQAETIIDRDAGLNPLAKSTNAPAPPTPATNLPPVTVTNTDATDHGK